MTEVESNSDFVLMPWDDKREIVLTEVSFLFLRMFKPRVGLENY